MRSGGRGSWMKPHKVFQRVFFFLGFLKVWFKASSFLFRFPRVFRVYKVSLGFLVLGFHRRVLAEHGF